eukprot:TRINITY_DN11675_c0_g1_i1.p2 TRINITY_DN11675_c0_g1~~TRINITY_DN11675_c0_g1_i1.p2  ORF type:complete len:156 (-),score=27.19 TRINITY_DN11675_c0_g1_i1:190-657(-)
MPQITHVNQPGMRLLPQSPLSLPHNQVQRVSSVPPPPAISPQKMSAGPSPQQAQFLQAAPTYMSPTASMYGMRPAATSPLPNPFMFSHAAVGGVSQSPRPFSPLAAGQRQYGNVRQYNPVVHQPRVGQMPVARRINNDAPPPPPPPPPALPPPGM